MLPEWQSEAQEKNCSPSVNNITSATITYMINFTHLCHHHLVHLHTCAGVILHVVTHLGSYRRRRRYQTPVRRDRVSSCRLPRHPAGRTLLGTQGRQCNCTRHSCQRLCRKNNLYNNNHVCNMSNSVTYSVMCQVKLDEPVTEYRNVSTSQL